MHKHRPVIECLHDSTESSEILGCGSLEIDRNMDIRHTEAGNDTPLVCDGVVRCWERKIDDCLEATLPNRLKLCLCGLTGSAQSVTDGSETINLGQLWMRILRFAATHMRLTLHGGRKASH